MGHVHSVGPAAVHQALATDRAPAERIGNGAAIEQAMPAAAMDRMAHASTAATLQRKLAGMIDDSPRQRMQRQVMGAVQQAVYAPAAPLPARPPVQLARLNIRARDGTISGVSNFPARPASNLRGAQGQHLTAYAVFEDAIRAKVTDRSPADAANGLKEYLDEILTLPGMQQQNAAYLVAAVATSRTALDDVANVEAQIDTILSIRNQVPGTAQRGAGGGHDEAGQAGRLRTVETALRKDAWKDEWDEDTVSDQCRAGVWQLLDFDPANPDDDDERAAIAKVIITHYKSVMSAYPSVDNWLNGRDETFEGYMEAHRDDAGMPLGQVDAEQMALIFPLVAAGI